MSNPLTRTYTAAGNVDGPQEAVSLDWLALDAATIAVAITSGTANYCIEFTFDDVNDLTRDPLWFVMNEFPVGTTTTQYTAIFYPFAFIRVNIEALTGTLVLKVAQSSTPSV